MFEPINYKLLTFYVTASRFPPDSLYTLNVFFQLPGKRLSQFTLAHFERPTQKENWNLLESLVNRLFLLFLLPSTRSGFHSSVCLVVCLFVSRITQKTTERISMQLSERIGHGPRKNLLHKGIQGIILSLPLTLWGYFFDIFTNYHGKNHESWWKELWQI